jgi:thiol-disulfide isomerase/thioredoxin/protocatechuate 3,4-dioxygenase beta subunit
MHSFRRSVWQGPLGLGIAVAFAAVTLDAERSALGIQGPKNDKSQADSAIKSEKATRSISGILVDRAGFPVSHAYIAVAGTDIWKGARSDEQGRFTLNKVPNEARAMIAVSRRSNRMGVASINPVSSKDVRLVLDCDTTWALGWVVDSNGQAVNRADVTLHVTGPKDVSYTAPGKSDKSGLIRVDELPAGRGYAVRASLATGESTPTVAIRNRGTVNLPTLEQRQPADPTAGKPPVLVSYSGRVVDEQNQPIAGVVVKVSAGVWDVNAVTDMQGHWSVRLPARIDQPEIELDHPDFVGFHFGHQQRQPAIDSLRDGSAVQTMQHGLRVTGSVRDSSGKPIGNALVFAGWPKTFLVDPSEVLEDSNAARTGRTGQFSLGGIPDGIQSVFLQADGFAPSIVSVPVAPGMKPAEFMLGNGRTVTGRVVDETGQPMPGARVSISHWQVAGAPYWMLPQSTRSGPDGRFTLSHIPREGAISGYAGARDRLFMTFSIASGSNDVGDVPLFLPPVIEGRVVDAESLKPIEQINVAVSAVNNDGRMMSSGSAKPIHTNQGQFRVSVQRWMIDREKEIRFAAKITARGYAALITPPVEPGKRQEPFLLKMKPAPAHAGHVLTPDGGPASGTRLCFAGPNNHAWVQGTELDERFAYTPDVRTVADSSGEFELPAVAEVGRILALHEKGYAVVATTGFHPGDTIRLIPWSRVEGTFRPGGKARPRVLVSIEAIRPRMAPDSRDRLVFELQATTDESGRFVFDHVPARQFRIAAHAAYGHAAEKIIQVEPGKTVLVQLADDGPGVRGRANLSSVIAANPPAPGLKFDTSTSWVRVVRVRPRPEAPEGVDRADWDRQFESVVEGTASKDLTIPTSAADLNPDGSFTFDALAPGTYMLLVDIHGVRPPQTCGWGLLLARGRKEFTVGNQPVDLGVLDVKVCAFPSVGSQGPEISGRTANNQPFSLTALRGQYVVLDFWAGWCAPCMAAQPLLKGVYEKHKARLAVVGLNFDYTDAQAQTAIDAIKTPWPQVLAGPWGEKNAALSAYGVELLPSLWLIDPTGKVLARDLTPEGLDKLIERTFR